MKWRFGNGMMIVRIKMDSTYVLLEFRLRRKNVPVNMVAKYFAGTVISGELIKADRYVIERCFFGCGENRRKLT